MASPWGRWSFVIKDYPCGIAKSVGHVLQTVPRSYGQVMSGA